MARIVTKSMAVGLLILAAFSAFAAESHSKQGAVFVNCVRVLELKAKFGQLDPATRALAVVRSLRLCSEEDPVSVHADEDNAVIKVGTSVSLKVTPQEAVTHGATVEKLANQWANAIRDALVLPTLLFPDNAYRLPVGGTKNLSLVGSEALDAFVTSSNESVAKVVRTESGVIVTAVGAGEAIIKAESGNAHRLVTITVRPGAARFPQSVTVDVVGDPANGTTVKGAIEGALKTQLKRLPGAAITFMPVTGDALGSGKTKSIQVAVRARLADTYDAVGEVTVEVRNVGISRKPDTALWYSNAPESVHQIGSLFASFLKTDEPVRFLYHHINASSQPMIIRAEAVNDTDVEARVLVCGADSKPDQNPVVAGMKAANKFLKYWITGSGQVLSIPPHSTLPIVFRRPSPKETVSGLCTLCLLGGPKELLVRADALPAFDLSPPWYNATFSSAPWQEVGTNPINSYDQASYEPSEHVYPDPYMDKDLKFEVGGRFGYVTIGQTPISGQDHSNNLDGNYGVIYRIKASLRNSTAAPADVDIEFESNAGYTGGLFVLNGQIVQTPFIGPKEHVRIARIHLAPGTSRGFEIVTIPISGGAYPATITVRPAG